MHSMNRTIPRKRRGVVTHTRVLVFTNAGFAIAIVVCTQKKKEKECCDHVVLWSVLAGKICIQGHSVLKQTLLTADLARLKE